MKERKTLTKALAEQYRRGSKGLKGEIVDQFAEATGYNRCYATRLLRNHGKCVYVRPDQAVEGDAHLRPQRTHRRTYDENVVAALTKIWELLDYMTGKRLAPALREVVPRLVACRELRLKKSLQQQLMQGTKVAANDAVLILNFEKNGQPNYLGGATFLEIFKAFELGKKIFLMNTIPQNIFEGELLGMSPQVINGDLSRIAE